VLGAVENASPSHAPGAGATTLPTHTPRAPAPGAEARTKDGQKAVNLSRAVVEVDGALGDVELAVIGRGRLVHGLFLPAVRLLDRVALLDWSLGGTNRARRGPRQLALLVGGSGGVGRKARLGQTASALGRRPARRRLQCVQVALGHG